jgi:outer membrane protein TolC
VLTLGEAQARASAKGKPADLAQLAVDAAKFHRQAVAADYYPKINSMFANLHFNKFLGQTIQLATRQVGLPLLAKDQTIFAATVTQPITPIFKVRQAVTIARADEAMAEARVSALTAKAMADVERTYFELLIAQRDQVATEAKANWIESGLQMATTGTLSLSTINERRATLLEANKHLATISSWVRELTASLNELVGFETDTELELTDPDPATETVSLAEATRQAQANSYELVEAEQAVVKAEAAIRLSKLDYVPDVAVTGGYFFQTALPLLPTDFTYVGVIASMNVFDFGKREKTASERSTQLAMARTNVDLVRAKVAAAVQKTFFDMERTRKIRDLTRRILGTYPTADTDGTRASAEKEMFQAELDYRLADAGLKRLMAGRPSLTD